MKRAADISKIKLNSSSDIPEMTVSELQTRLERGDPTFVLDIRTKNEYSEWSIPGSIHIDEYQRLKSGDPDALAEFAAPSNVQIVIVCNAGNTSRIAVERLRMRGITAYSLTGGMKAWSFSWNTAELTGKDAKLIQVRRTGKGCLSYIVGSNNDAIVIDPSLDPDVYIGLARDQGWTIRHVMDTHIHADHLSRSRVLTGETNAALWLPEQHRTDFSHNALHEGDKITFGNSGLIAISTPGHTRESMCYSIDDEWLLTGDTLFLNSVGRPDLEADERERHSRALLIHASLNRLFSLNPALLVLPGHTSSPVDFDGKLVADSLGNVCKSIDLHENAEMFAQKIIGRVPLPPSNHHIIVSYNEKGHLPEGDLSDLEAGANRCAIA